MKGRPPASVRRASSASRLRPSSSVVLIELPRIRCQAQPPAQRPAAAATAGPPAASATGRPSARPGHRSANARLAPVGLGTDHRRLQAQRGRGQRELELERRGAARAASRARCRRGPTAARARPSASRARCRAGARSRPAAEFQRVELRVIGRAPSAGRRLTCAAASVERHLEISRASSPSVSPRPAMRRPTLRTAPSMPPAPGQLARQAAERQVLGREFEAKRRRRRWPVSRCELARNAGTGHGGADRCAQASGVGLQRQLRVAQALTGSPSQRLDAQLQVQVQRHEVAQRPRPATRGTSSAASPGALPLGREPRDSGRAPPRSSRRSGAGERRRYPAPAAPRTRTRPACPAAG